MRIKNTIKNSFTSLISYLYLFLVGVFLRKLFLETFSLEYLGYEGLFGSIFLLLSIAELGASGMFGYMLYSAIAQNDRNEISIIMGMYKKLYICIGLFVLFSGIVLFFFLPMIIVEDVEDWRYVRIIYLFHLFSTLSTYFLAYRRALYIAEQKAYVILKIEALYKTINTLCRVIVIFLFRNYILYLFVPFITNLLANINIWLRSKKDYPDIYSYDATWQDFKKRNAFLQLKSLLISKISTIIYTSSDNIIIARLVGIKNVGFYSNYNQIYNWGVQIVWSIIGPLNESTGNMIYSESKDKSKSFFDAFDLASYFLGTIGLCVIVCCFQKMIAFLYGTQYLLTIFTLIALGENFYVTEKGAAYNAFQNAIGHYETNRIYSVLSAVTNVVFSIIFGIYWGITGILLATIIGNVFIQAGRAHVVYKWLFTMEKIRKIVLKEINFFISANLTLLVVLYLTQRIQANLIGILLSIMISVIIPIVVGILFYFKTSMFISMKCYIMNSAKIVISKF